MIIIVLILFAVYLIAYLESRPRSAERKSHYTSFQILLGACVLTAFIFAFAYRRSSQPPYIDYYSTGWIGYIRELNVIYASTGRQHRIADPGN